MSADYKWPASTLCPPGYTHCVRLTCGAFYWARKVRRHPLCGTEYIRRSVERRSLADHVIHCAQVAAAVQCGSTATQPALHVYPRASTQLYSATFLNTAGMGWVKTPTGPVVTMRAPYDEMLTRVKELAELYPDTTYTVVKVCAEVRTPPKPTLEVKEY